MSEKQKTLAEKLASLPPKLQDKFIDKVDGATMALDFIAEGDSDKEEGG